MMGFFWSSVSHCCAICCRLMKMFKEKSLIIGLWGTRTLLGLRRLVYHNLSSFNAISFVWRRLNSLLSLTNLIGHFDTYSSGYCNGICIRRRTFWENMQCRALQGGRGSYSYILHSSLVFFFSILHIVYVLFLFVQARFFFQQLISGVSFCHAMVFESFPRGFYLIYLFLDFNCSYL